MADARLARPSRVFTAQMEWVTRLGGAFVESSWARVALSVFLPSPVYSMADKIRYAAGARHSAAHLLPEVEERNLFAEVPGLALPAYFVHGRHDRQVPPALTEEYVRTFAAPSKQLLFLEHSAHGALFEEPEAFHEILVKSILAETTSQHDRRVIG
ncbi:MAG: alpha/beta hydrolase [Candidatus Bipolaricaulota bacterium]|nr:alpha/beta hydrolase [Candidatus Bipolaricaulota bacterium]